MKAKCFHFGFQDVSETCLECESSNFLIILKGTVSQFNTIVENNDLLCKKCIKNTEAECSDFSFLSSPICPENFPVVRKVLEIGTVSPNFSVVCEKPLVCFSCESLVYDSNAELGIYS